MISAEYTKKIVKDYSNKFTEIERKATRNKIRDFINKTDNNNFIKELYKICVYYGMEM